MHEAVNNLQNAIESLALHHVSTLLYARVLVAVILRFIVYISVLDCSLANVFHEIVRRLIILIF